MATNDLKPVHKESPEAGAVMLQLKPGEPIPDGYVRLPTVTMLARTSKNGGSPWTPKMQRVLSNNVPEQVVGFDVGDFGPIARFLMSNGKQQSIYFLSESDASDTLFSRLTSREKRDLLKHVRGLLRSVEGAKQ